jgi:hypothetical protein
MGEIMNFDYDKSETVGDYIYFYKTGKIVAVYNPFVGLSVKTGSNLN